MAKILRYTGNVKAFGSNATGTDRTVFGDTIQSDALNDNLNANFLSGWGILAPGAKPPKEYFNGALFTATQLTSYLFQQGIPEWDSAQEYFINGVAIGSDGLLYRSLTSANINNDPTTDTTNINWIETIKKDLPRLINASTAKTTPVDADLIPLVDSAASFTLKKITWANIKTTLASTFALLNSPSFIGTPTAPTQAVGNNTTLLATTAFVNAEISNDVGIANSPLVKTALNAAGAAPIYACRAWVNFNGTGTVAIRASGNVSSITDNGVGNYRANFATAIEDTSYSVASNGSAPTTSRTGDFGPSSQADLLTTSVRLFNINNTNTPIDAEVASVTIFR